MIKSFVRKALPVVLAIGLLTYALKDISFRAISEQFKQANYGLISLVGLVTVCSYFLRGKRWQQPLLALGYRPTAFRTTIAMQTGIISSMIVLGSGELTRCATLQRTDGIPLSQGIGSVVAERIVDLFMLALVMLLTLLLEFSRMRNYLAGLDLAAPNAYLVLGVISLFGLIGLIAWRTLRSPLVRQHPFAIRIFNLLLGFGKGFMSIRQLPQPGLFMLLTFLNQLLSWLITYLLLLAVESTQHLPPSAALTILTVSSLGGLAVPTQGGIGTYHFLVSRALVLYGFSSAEGAVVATFLHAVGFGINLLLSSLSFLLLPLLITTKATKHPDSLVE
ncbi:lysylphosphatidylglycerol synthase transmembrane domain-containing protein [Spirosoma sp. KUDC1026]|uniref:lysylphosphatidylglycerol synthase transmembrane domain-containing protein n=1 Tax=Spirosoma sp. KUDC1026 TaxID=2745947 RepID=UPI00159BC411|nr:lysylphosphatidylglycerol synthase transmembrane domain-containing protein [Spirosoma sp. KUDC1026]QKZ11543.1 flippase-like domain-containing protein [Spirosoma sp. KUDC1026]